MANEDRYRKAAAQHADHLDAVRTLQRVRIILRTQNGLSVIQRAEAVMAQLDALTKRRRVPKV